jgi:hypothetical protein
MSVHWRVMQVATIRLTGRMGEAYRIGALAPSAEDHGGARAGSAN